MTLARLSPREIRPSVDEKKLHWLGRAAGFDYAEYQGTEYAVTVSSVDPQAFAREPGELMVTKRVRELFDGTPTERDTYRRATIAPSGTYAALAAKEAAAKAYAGRKAVPKPVDLLASHALLRRKQAEMLRVAPEADAPELFGQLSERVRGIMLPAREPVRGPGAILTLLAAKGVTVSLSADGQAIVPLAAKGLPDTVRSLIAEAAPLLVAHLRGEPLRCQLTHQGTPPEAESLLVGGAGACAAHLSGELAL